MKTNFRQTIGQITITCFALLTLALPKQARAQFTGNNQTNIISGMTSNWPGFYYVGSNYVFDALFIKNNGVLSNGACVIGGSVGANSNLAVVSGSDSVWNNTNFVAVGSPGAGNRLVISNGGKVIVTGAFGGPPTVSSVVGLRNLGPTSNNAALVTGTGSLWSNRYDLRVGFSGLDLTSRLLKNLHFV